jgi:hypothetical protein
LNFIAHYFPASHIPSPEFHLGLVMPDLVRISNKSLRLKPTYQPVKLHEAPMQTGINLHVATDHFFHNTSFFHDGSAKLIGLLRSFSFQQIRRISFLGHVFLELLLDRWLLIHHPDEGEHFYHSLGQVKSSALHKLFTSQGKATYAGDFEAFLKKFIGYRYLLLYPNDDELAYALTRIYFRATGLMPTADTPILKNLIQEAEQALTPDFEAFFPDFELFFEKQVAAIF